MLLNVSILLSNALYIANEVSVCPHAAFELQVVQDVTLYRESVECAVLLIYPRS